MLLNQNPIPSSYFHWNREGQTFSQEISSLNGFILFQRIYDDAVDEGFSILSNHTGQIITFYHSKTDYDGNEGDDSDVAGWWFEVVPEHARKYPWLANIKVLIIND